MRRLIGIPLNAFLCLSVGELQDRKNHGIVIEALKKLEDYNNIFYAIAGRGKLKKQYEDMIFRYELADKVKLLGFRSDIIELCRAADCFIHPSIREGFGIAPMEAMASGLPLISADINGLKDYTKEGITGCCVNPHSVDEMCAAITKIYTDKTFCSECGENNMRIARNYDLERSLTVVGDIIMG